MFPPLHDIQRSILISLMQGKGGKKYAKMKGQGIENDLYNYHLGELKKKEYIRKEGSLYELTELGKKFISQLNAKGDQEKLFKVSVALIVFNSNQTEILLQERRRTPFFGDITSVAGKIRYGEPIIQAASRKLQEETGLLADFTFIGVNRKIKRNTAGEVLEDTLYHYCIAKNPSGELISENEFGRNFWAPKEMALVYEKKNVDTGTYDQTILERFIAGDFSPFYYEQDATLSEY